VVFNRVGDLFATVKPEEKFDLIVSNPPYLAPGEFAELATDVRDHEPRMALDCGPDGLAFYRRISSAAGQYLNLGGWIAVEVGHTQSQSVQKLFQETGWQSIQVMKDMNGIERVISAKKV
jgi:release factor glutamine methyltransferase